MNQYKALMAGFAAVVGAGGIAAYNGAFTAPSPTEVTQKTTEPAAAAAEPATSKEVAPEVAKLDPKATAPAAEPEKPALASETTTPAAAAPSAPTFDVLRVEANGSVLIAGRAEKDAQVEILSGANVLGAAKAQANGDFAIVLDTPLKPGDYQLVLRQTSAAGTAATSIETATVSVPDKLDGPVLALVEEPGKPSRIITAPAPVEAEIKAQGEIVATAPAEPEVAVNAPEASASDPAPTATQATVKIEAVETEGSTVFVAGAADGLNSVRIYANDEVLGETKTLTGGRFLVEIQKQMTPGDYIIKAEGLAKDGVTVVARSVVPFTQDGDQKIATAAREKLKAPLLPEPKTEEQTASAEPQKMAVVIRRGDTLWQISRRIYGRGVRFSTIYLANKSAIPNPNKIFPGQVVAIPDNTAEGDAANMEEIKKREVKD